MSPDRTLSRRKFLKTTIKSAGLLSAAAASGFFPRCEVKDGGYDLVIYNCSIIDGTGKPGFGGSVGIIGDKIVNVGKFGAGNAPVSIDAKGRIVAPGFINIHGHTENALVANPEGMSSILQGVTTEVAGQCGGSQGPLTGDSLESNRNRNSDRHGFDRGFENISDFLDFLEMKKIGINFATMVGHGTIRSAVIGQEGREPTTEELNIMRILVDENIQGGAFGFTTGLEYTPGSFAKIEELIELAKPLNQYGLPYASHMRNEDNFLLEAIEEALTIGERAECPVQISHLKVQGKPNWNKIDTVFEKIETASRQRGNVHFDRYPYTAYSTGLSNLFPVWCREGGTRKFLDRLKNNTLQKRIRTYVENKVSDLESWHAVMISRAGHADDRQYIGRRMDEIAAEKGTIPYDETVKMLFRNNGGVGMVGFGMSEENTQRILSHPLGMICSDGSAMPAGGSGSPHPRSFGTFARALGYYARDKGIFDLPAVINKLTSMPAEKLKLQKRGKITEGYFADIAVFDPAAIKDTATFENPMQYAQGVDHVIVNGRHVVQSGKHSGELAGHVLRFKA
jgi:N-acyl-D-amino-acid deacylase